MPPDDDSHAPAVIRSAGVSQVLQRRLLSRDVHFERCKVLRHTRPDVLDAFQLVMCKRIGISLERVGRQREGLAADFIVPQSSQSQSGR